MFGDAAPLIQQLGVDVFLVLDVRPARAEEGLQRLGAQLPGGVIVLSAEAKAAAEPLVIHELTHRVGFFDVLPIGLDMGLQHRRSIYPQGHDSDSLFRRQFVCSRLEGGNPDGRMGLLERLGQNLPRRHAPELPFPFKGFRLPYLGNHGDGFVPHLPRVSGVDSHPHLLIGRRPAGTELDPSVGKLVHHCYPLGHPHRMVVRQDNHAESQPDVLGQPAQGAKYDLRAG